jgi:hypothetical protein
MSGYLYCLYNDAFERFKQDENDEVYKLGRTCNVSNRLASYSTYYVQPSQMLYVSQKFKDCTKAERVLFYILRKYRVSNKREFFKCDLELVKETFDRMSSFTPKMIDEMYRAIITLIFPENLLERIEKEGGYVDAKVIANDEWFMYEKGNMSSIIAYLEQFRFKPKNPASYPGYSPINNEFIEVFKRTNPDVKMMKPVRDPRSLVKVTLSFVEEDEDNLKENFENLNI